LILIFAAGGTYLNDYVYFSDDGGEHWTLSPTALPLMDEIAVATLTDGLFPAVCPVTPLASSEGDVCVLWRLAALGDCPVVKVEGGVRGCAGAVHV
jgi:hypothetical protein